MSIFLWICLHCNFLVCTPEVLHCHVTTALYVLLCSVCTINVTGVWVWWFPVCPLGGAVWLLPGAGQPHRVGPLEVWDETVLWPEVSPALLPAAEPARHGHAEGTWEHQPWCVCVCVWLCVCLIVFLCVSGGGCVPVSLTMCSTATQAWRCRGLNLGYVYTKLHGWKYIAWWLVGLSTEWLTCNGWLDWLGELVVKLTSKSFTSPYSELLTYCWDRLFCF